MDVQTDDMKKKRFSMGCVPRMGAIPFPLHTLGDRYIQRVPWICQ